jgi:hypothetical protein
MSLSYFVFDYSPLGQGEKLDLCFFADLCSGLDEDLRGNRGYGSARTAGYPFLPEAISLFENIN